MLDRLKYDECIEEIINDDSKFKKLQGDVTLKREGQLQRFLRKIKNSNFFDDSIYKKIYPIGSSPAKIYGLPKLHKSFPSNSYPPFRPIVSSIGTYNYNLSKFLCSVLSPLISTRYCTKDSFTFVQEFNQVNITNSFLVSFDVCSLFTNIPLNETIDIAVNLIFENNSNLNISKSDLNQLFLFATAQTHFIFKGNFYDQIDGVTMGSPLAPVLANLFMGHHERKWISDYQENGPSFYKRYVDDIFAVFNNENEANMFLDYLNQQHNNIKFTIEKEANKIISFLDINIDHNNNIVTSIFRKKTFAGLMTNVFSYTAFSYKIGLIKCLVKRIFGINNTSL